MSSDWYIFIANAYLLPCSSCSSAYPAIRSDAERHDYKREFDADLKEYKRLCAEMDDINDHLNKLSRQLDTLDDTSAKYQVRYTQKLSPNLMRKANVYDIYEPWLQTRNTRLSPSTVNSNINKEKTKFSWMASIDKRRQNNIL